MQTFKMNISFCVSPLFCARRGLEPESDGNDEGIVIAFEFLSKAILFSSFLVKWKLKAECIHEMILQVASNAKQRNSEGMGQMASRSSPNTSRVTLNENNRKSHWPRVVVTDSEMSYLTTFRFNKIQFA